MLSRPACGPVRGAVPAAFGLLCTAVLAVALSGPHPAAARLAVDLGLEVITRELSQPVDVAHAGDGSGRLFVVEKRGTVRIVQHGALLPDFFLDIRDRVRSGGFEQGLLGIAFHPRYAENGFFFVNYTDHGGATVVARYRVSGDPQVTDPAGERIVLRIVQPASNHNAGMLAFGPDGYLYVGTGDGGGAGDPFRTAQDRRSLLGKMLRIDVDGGDPYAIPPDNPFVGDPQTLDEIWALGLRNPWRYAFDPATGDLWIADVGQNRIEEINLQPAASRGGENYGWSMMEGSECFPPGARCDPAGLVLPVAEYRHDLGCSVTGGYVYRGARSHNLQGAYVFGDYCSGRIWALHRAGDEGVMTEMLHTSLRISSFGEDEAGEHYVVSLSDNGLYRLVPRDRES